MEFIRKTVDSVSLYGLFDIPPALRNKRVEVIILPVEGNVGKTANQTIRLGFVKGSPLPESFFDPLPEKELQAWEL